jgi:hypothetical protein
VGPRADLDTEARGKILCLCRGSNPGLPVCSQTLCWLNYTAPSTGQEKIKFTSRYKCNVVNYRIHYTEDKYNVCTHNVKVRIMRRRRSRKRRDLKN